MAILYRKRSRKGSIQDFLHCSVILIKLVRRLCLFLLQDLTKRLIRTYLGGDIQDLLDFRINVPAHLTGRFLNGGEHLRLDGILADGHTEISQQQYDQHNDQQKSQK